MCHVVVETPENSPNANKVLLREMEEINQLDPDKHSPKAKSWMAKVKDFFQ